MCNDINYVYAQGVLVIFFLSVLIIINNIYDLNLVYDLRHGNLQGTLDRIIKFMWFTQIKELGCWMDGDHKKLRLHHTT
jgi:hypothetical protein